MNFTILCRSFEAPTQPYQIKQTESDIRLQEIEEMLHFSLMNKFAYICIINNTIQCNVLKPPPALSDKQTESKSAAIIFFIDFE